MKFTLSWLKDYLDSKEDLGTICNKLTDIGLEIEDVEDSAKDLEIFTIAKILEASPHQDSDKLQICKVDVGQKEPLQIICGASNARSGIKVIYAKIGSIIPTNKMKIKKSKIRGVESHGMLCSASELGIGEDSEGIVEIDEKHEIGTKITEIFNLGEAVIDINITPNRGDCLGVYGIARDLSSAGLGKLKKPETKTISGKFNSEIKVNIEEKAQELCPYFAGYYIKNVTNKETPDFIKDRLEAVGVNSISAIVDITNYVMLCLNQPLHAYDADKVEGDIKVNIANSGDKYRSLKEVDYTLNGEEILISDSKKIIGLAGIVGGESSTTELDTKNIFLEGAFFDAVSIARTGRKLNILSDARYRFERTVDLKGVKRAIDMAANLILEICGGEISNIVEAGSPDYQEKEIEFCLKRVKEVLNVDIEKKQITSILSNLGFEPEDISSDKIKVAVPSFRSDITIEEDLIEEVIRIYGYNKIESHPLKSAKFLEIQHKFNLNSLRTDLCNIGLDEVINWSFIDEKIAINFANIDPSLKIANSISEEMDYMRPSLLPGLLGNIKKNQLRGFANLSLFEIGKIFNGTDAKDQINTVSGVRSGKNKSKNHYKDERSFDVMDVKKDTFTALESLGINPKSVQIVQEGLPLYFHPYKSAILKMGKNIVGYFGEIHPAISKKLSIKTQVNAFEIYIDKLPVKNNTKSKKKVFIKSDYQIVNRDFAFIFDQNVQISNIIKLVKATDQELISNVNIFDIYQGENIGSDKKSIAFNVEISPKVNTLTSEEIEGISNKIISVISEKLNGNLRAG